MTLPPRLAALGNFIESRFAPPMYRRTPIVTLSESSKREIVHDLHFPEANVTVVPPGIDPQYTPDGKKSSDPLVVAVGRLVPVKRFDMLIDALLPPEGAARRSARGDRGGGVLPPRPGSADPRRAAPRTGSACPAA